MTATQLAFHHQDARTPATMASESQDASLDHLLAHLESSKQALEHQVQQLLQENRLSKSAKKEQQWHMEGERLHSKLDSLNSALMEREERIRQLEKELRDSRGSIHQVQSRCREAEKEKERGNLERANLQADLEDAQSNFRNLEREYKLKLDVAEKQRRALESLSDKVEKQRVSFQNQLEDARGNLVELEERELKSELAAHLSSQHLAEKERQLKSLRDAHEKLLAVQKSKQADERHEVKEVVILLESSHAKCEEQKALILELEGELGRIKKQARELDSRIAAAEADASSKSSMLEKVQQELNNTSSKAVILAKSKAQTEDLETQVQTLKRNLQDVENMLSDESALRFKAECVLNEYKVREKTFLKVEQELQEEVKWRNEQFESLEEAHNKMRDQFHEGLSMWASERAAILHDIEVLTEKVQSRDFVIHDLRSKVKLLEQSLAHEENCRKLLEFQLTDAKAGYESVSAEYLGAQSILESLRENSKKELVFLKDTLAERDSQLKELHVKELQIDRDQKKMMHLEAELDSYKSRCERLQQALEKGNVEVTETGVPLDSEDRDFLTRTLTDAEATIAKKEVEMKELEMELDRTRTLSELLRTSLSEAEQKRLEGNSDAMQTVEKLSTALSAKEQHAIDLEMEVERLQVVVNDVRKCNAEAEQRIRALEDRLRDAHSELQTTSRLSHSVLNIQEHEDVVHAMRSECQTLQRQLNTCDFEKFEIEKHRDKLLAEQKQQYQEKQELVLKLERLGQQFAVKNARVNDLLDQIEKEKQVLRAAETRCSSLEQELSKQLLLAEEIREELIAEKRIAQEHQERNQALDTALSADTAAKDASLKEIKETLHELTVLCKGGGATSQTQLRMSSIEEKLKNQDVLGGQLVSLLGEVEQVAQGVGHLNIELNSLKDDSKLTKTEFEARLKAVEGLFSSSFAELQEISEQVGKMNAERMSLVDVLNKKEGVLELLNMENNNLNIEKHRLESNADVLAERLHHLVKEAESKKGIIVTLNVNMKAAEEGVATLHDFHGKLEESENKNMQLVNVADQVRGLQRKLRATEEIVHDKEQRLAASEWAVQQLASEIAKSKSCLVQKEKDETASRDLVEHSEAELKVKERELMVLECDLENAVKTNNDNVAIVQQLTLSKGEMGRVLELTKHALEEKAATLATSEAEIKRLLETQRLTEEALESCKERLSNELTTNLSREQDMKRLCEDIERANQEASLADVDVKNLQASLKCLERTTETRLESCERKLQEGAADLAEYQENCSGLLTLTEKKDSRIQQLEFEVTHAEKELERQVMLAEQGEQELRFVSEELQSKTKILTSLKVELATMDNLVRESDTQKQGLEEEVRGLKSSLSLASRDLKQKAMEIEDQLRIVNQLKSALSHQGDAHSKELQMVTSNAAEETDSKVFKLQAALNGAHDELGDVQKMLSIKESEKRVLSLRLSELESLVEKGKSQVSHLQADLLFARANLDAQTERVWHQVSTRNEFEIELDRWKRKAAALTESQAEFESEVSRLQGEINDWKEVTEHTKNLSQKELEAWEVKVASNYATIEKSQVEVMEWKAVAERTMLQSAELEKSMQAVQESVVGWENMITSLADEGDIAKLQLELVLKQVHDEFRTLHGELANTKDMILVTRQEGHTLKAEFLSVVNEVMNEQTVLTLSREEGESFEVQRLQAVVSDLERELSVWKAKALNSEVEAQSQLKRWSQRAEEWESFNEILEQAFLDFEHAVLACKSDAGSSASDLERDLKLDIRVSFQNLRKEVEEAKSEMLEFKELAAFETERAQLEFQDCVNSLQAEVEVWKGKAAVATEDGSQMKYQFEDLIKNLQRELKNWKQFEALALGDDSGAQTVENDTVVVAGMGESCDFSDIALNPFYQEDEGCSSAQDNDDSAASQLDGWKTKSLAEGRKLTRQLRASLKHLQFELESRKQTPRAAKHDFLVHRRDDTGLESLVKALQEEAVEIKAELAVWKKKAHETGIKKEDLERAIDKLNAEVEVWKDRSAMSAGQRIVARRQLDDLAKQVKSLTGELQKWKDVATEANEGATKLQSEAERWQKESEEVRGETNEWMQKALELNCVSKDLEEKLKQSGGELEHLRAEVERWRTVAMKAEDEGKVTKMELLDTLGKFEDELEVMSGNSIGGCSTAGGRSLKEEDLDCSLESSGRVSNEWRHELEISLQAEIEVWKKKVAEEEDLRQAYETTIKELQMEVDALKKSAAFVAEVRQREIVELEKKMKDVEAKEHFAEVQGELQIWKKRTADATEECTSLRDTYENVIQELQIELALWKAKSETATDECQSVRADLENVVHDLQSQAHVWKLKAEKALENVVKTQEYEDLIKALEEELCLWMQRTQESKLLHLQLENEQVLLKESLAGTQNELRKWKDKISAVTSASIQSLRGLATISEEDDKVNIYPLHDEDEDVVNIDLAVESQQLQDWKSRAEQAELLQLQLENVLAETQTELHGWKQKTAGFSLAAEFLKEELESLVEEGRLEKEELIRSNSELEAWRQRAQDSETRLESSNLALQKLEETAVAITQSTRSLMEELDLTIEGGLLEKQEFSASISALKDLVLLWKEKVASGESMQPQLRTTLLETQAELQDMKDKAAVAVATKSEDIRQQNEILYNTINELEAELLEWKSRAQEGVSVQLQFERALLETEEKAGIAAMNTQALRDELDRTISESSSESHELRTAITGLETELSELRESGPSRLPQLLQLQNTLTETQSQLLEWQDKATVASQAEAELRQAVEIIRAETVKLDNFIRTLKDELHEWKEKAEHLETLQIQLTCSLASSSEELQRWKQKATEMEPNLDLRNLVSQWKKKTQEGEFLHRQAKESLTETHIEIKELKDQIVVLNLFTDSLKDELKSANEFVSTLTTQLSTQKQNEESLLQLNQQLEADLVLAREEASSRKHKMTQILSQLEGNRESQMELQTKLHLAQRRLLGIEKVHSQTENVNRGIGETAAAKANFCEPDDKMNPAVGKMRQELFSLKSLVSKLEHVRGNDGEQSEASSSVAGDDELAVAEEISTPRAASLPSRPEGVLQKQFESCKAVEEVAHPQMKKGIDGLTRARAHSLARFKVLADVNGNSPRTTANHDIKLHR